MDVLVHFDFKGLPPAVDLCCVRLSEMKRMGATGVVFEWEDTFPYSGKLAHLSSKHAYSSSDVSRIISTANDLGLEVVPLVQTLGHAEYILEHNQFLKAGPGTLDPRKVEMQTLIQGIIGEYESLRQL